MNKAVMTRSRLESLCRELQKQNKAIRVSKTSDLIFVNFRTNLLRFLLFCIFFMFICSFGVVKDGDLKILCISEDIGQYLKNTEVQKFFFLLT